MPNKPDFEQPNFLAHLPNLARSGTLNSISMSAPKPLGLPQQISMLGFPAQFDRIFRDA
jgi:hypothetical protein